MSKVIRAMLLFILTSLLTNWPHYKALKGTKVILARKVFAVYRASEARRGIRERRARRARLARWGLVASVGFRERRASAARKVRRETREIAASRGLKARWGRVEGMELPDCKARKGL